MTIRIFNFCLQRKKEKLNSSQSIWNHSFSEPFQSGSNSLIFQGRGFQGGGNDPCSKYPINFQISSVDDQIKMKNWQTLPHHGTDKSRHQLTGLRLGEVTQPLEGRGGELSYGGYKVLPLIFTRSHIFISSPQMWKLCGSLHVQTFSTTWTSTRLPF